MVIDSNIFIEHLRAKDKPATKFSLLLNERKKLFISAVSVFELYMGATNMEKEKSIQLLIEGIAILPFDYKVSIKSAEIFHHLKSKNQLIEFRDIFIAATCLVNDLPIITLNSKHFERIEALKIIQ